MNLDSSAVTAIFLKEPGYEVLLDKLEAVGQVGIGAPTLVGCAIVLTARIGRDARGVLARFLEEAQITVVPFTDRHFGMAVSAWIRFGKGRHPAELNFGDCLAYAVAQTADMPLLFAGDDFSETDITSA